MSNSPPPSSSTLLTRFLQIAAVLLIACAAVGLMIYLWGESTFDGVMVWVTRLVALGLIGVGLAAWRLPLKVLYLAGEEDEWYVLLGWDRRTIGFVKAGITRITPVQQTEAWGRVQPLFIKHDVKAQNKLLDSFDVHARVRLDVYPSVVSGADARWLRDQYPKGVAGMAQSLLTDVITAQLRKITSFREVVEQEAEAMLREAINQKFGFLAHRGVYIDETATFVDVMVSAELLMQRSKTRAELSTLQIIRDVAHDMGISTDELLIQRALEQLPTARSRQSISEITAVLQMLRQQPVQKPTVAQLPIRSEAEVLPPPIEDEIGDVVEDEAPVSSVQRPLSYVEGQYQAIDPNDPDSEGDSTKSIFSPF